MVCRWPSGIGSLSSTASDIFRYRDNGSYAGFANFFRYELLRKRGGWWVDLDTICLRPFPASIP